MLQDLRFAVRMLVKDRWFTLVAVVALGLGIGVNTTVFTFVNAVLLRGLPFADPERIVIVTAATRRQANASGVVLPGSRGLARTGQVVQRPGRPSSRPQMNVTDSGRPPERTSGRARLRQRVQRCSASNRISGGTSCRTKTRKAPIPSSSSATASGRPATAATPTSSAE